MPARGSYGTFARMSSRRISAFLSVMSCGWISAISSIGSISVRITAQVRPSMSPRVTRRIASFYHNILLGPDEHRKAAAHRRRSPALPMGEMGSVPRRPLLGHGARGLQRRRRRVGVPAARPRAVEGLPLGGGRHRRLLRSLSDPLLVDGLLERARS